MNPAVIGYVLQALQVIPQLVAAGQSVAALVSQTETALKAMQAENRDPSAAEWAAQAKIIDDLRNLLHTANRS